MTDAIAITPAQAGDVATIIGLLAEAGLPVGDIDELPAIGFLVARHDGEVCGAVGLERYGPIGLLRSLVVKSDRRRRNLGRRLVEHIEDTARRSGVEELWLLTLDAARWFEGRGFEAVDRASAPHAITVTREFADLCPANAVLMRKELGV